MIFIYFMALSFSLFAIGLAGVAASRHFLIMMLSVEVAIIASTLLATAFFYFTANGNIITLLLSMWTVASMEVLALIVFYRYLAAQEVSLDVSKLSKLKN
ncbi:MAG TPA: NADH-quinone oxidoreductase subunit K [Candidatus Baltobacteraceae bacterium]|nr:NADH-quinone oxidoreductase subunit K [Candidatus Baltobacteraceae bacterium]